MTRYSETMARRPRALPPLTAPLSEDRRPRLPKGERTRQAILDRAAARASEHGLDSLSLGALAEELAMSKSGLFAHFGSKEELQLATVEHARQIFLVEVIEPALELPQGIERLRGLCEAWVSYVERAVFPGGCFFSTATPEFANRPGAVRDRLWFLAEQWLKLLENASRAGRRKGQFKQTVEPRRLAFELFAIGDTANRYHGLLGPAAIAMARRAFDDRITDASSEVA
jgi:AcrR family transcriptional regulator